MSLMSKARVAVLVGSQGRGSNMANLIRAGLEGTYPGQVVLVIAAGERSEALEVARALGVAAEVLSPRDEDYPTRLGTLLTSVCVDLVCLAGYMSLLPVEVLKQFPNRVLNIHPALLPKFGGKGMFGIHVHEAVVARGESVTGASVHFVNEKYDEGRIVMQLSCPVEPGETALQVAAKVLALEHKLYPLAVAEVLKSGNSAS